MIVSSRPRIELVITSEKFRVPAVKRNFFKLCLLFGSCFIRRFYLLSRMLKCTYIMRVSIAHRFPRGRSCICLFCGICLFPQLQMKTSQKSNAVAFDFAKK